MSDNIICSFKLTLLNDLLSVIRTTKFREFYDIDISAICSQAPIKTVQILSVLRE